MHRVKIFGKTEYERAEHEELKEAEHIWDQVKEWLQPWVDDLGNENYGGSHTLYQLFPE
jgi:hypothetical protein